MSISQTYSPSARAGLVPVLLAALVCSGCLFTETAPATPSENNEENNTVVVLDEDMNTSSGDMGSEEDLGGDEEDLGTPPPPDMEEDLSCDRDEDCEGELTCIDGTCQLDTSGCEQDQDCGPMGVCNADGSCTNLVDDPENCGVKGFACPPNTFCGGGMCVCDGINPRNNSKVIATSTNDGLVHYPKPQMVGHFTAQRFACDGVVLASLEDIDCENGDLTFNQNYATDQAHYILGFASGPNKITIRLIDEQGNFDPALDRNYIGKANIGEKELRSFRFLQGFGPETVMVAWWHDSSAPVGARDFIHLYNIPVENNRIVLEPAVVEVESNRPFRPLITSDLLDFGFSFSNHRTSDGRSVEVFALAYVRDQEPGIFASRAELRLNLFITEKGGSQAERTQLVTEQEPIILGEARQLLTGFPVLAGFENDNLFINTTTLEASEDNVMGGDLPTAYNMRVFRVPMGSNAPQDKAATLVEPQPWTLYKHVATSFLDIISDIAGSNDQSDLPPSPFIIAAEPPFQWVALGWSRALNAQDNKRRARLNMVYTEKESMVTPIEPSLEEDNRYVYDQALVANPLDPSEPLLVWLEADQASGETPETSSAVKFASLLIEEGALPAIGEDRELTGMKINAQRVSSQFGTRSMGVFAYGKDEIRFFAIVDNEPVCAIPGKMP